MRCRGTPRDRKRNAAKFEGNGGKGDQNKFKENDIYGRSCAFKATRDMNGRSRSDRMWVAMVDKAQKAPRHGGGRGGHWQGWMVHQIKGNEASRSNLKGKKEG